MFFLLSNFIHPIKKPITLSSHFGFYFDNARSEEEKKIIRKLITKAWELSGINGGFNYQRFPMEKEVKGKDLVTFESIIKQYFIRHYGETEADIRIKEITTKKKIIEFYVKNWVIVRFGTSEMEEEHKKIYKKFSIKKRPELILLDDDHIFVKREKQLLEYSHVISLLAGGSDYYGGNFLISKNTSEVEQYSPNIYIMKNILEQAITNMHPPKKSDRTASKYNFTSFIDASKKMTEKLDMRLDQNEITEEKILYIGDILESSRPLDGQFSSLVRLVSIIEMLLTHQPDFNRFNVEESITKQFILKTGVIAQARNNKLELNTVKSKLKEIYAQRSNIVHGNFDAVHKYIKSQEYGLEELISESYKYVDIVLKAYINNPKFINFLKEN